MLGNFNQVYYIFTFKCSLDISHVGLFNRFITKVNSPLPKVISSSEIYDWIFFKNQMINMIVDSVWLKLVL